ncbi:MAG: arylsulfatase A-like enzyme [Candidatus Paceibacteria bacterium]|jgi:arylsulfatase A-like enzyme
MRAMVLGVLVGGLLGLLEIGFHPGAGEFSTQLSTHIIIGALGTLLTAGVLALVPRWRPNAANWGAALTAIACGVSVWFLRAHMGELRQESWTSPGHVKALGMALAVCTTCMLLVALALTKLGWLGKWTEAPVTTRLAGALLILSLLWAPQRVAGPYPVQLGDWGPADAAPHNVLLITIDTLRQDHLSQYGYDRPTSLALDRFGFTRFEENVAVANWTKPCTASILTGVYPSTHGAYDTMHVLPDAAITITERLAEQGVATGFCASNLNASGVFNVDQGAHFTLGDPARPIHTLGDTTLGEVLRQATRSLWDARNMNRYAEGFLRAAHDRRFFLYLHYNDPHTPYDPPAEYLERFTRPYEGRDLSWPHDSLPLSDSETARMIDRYDAEVADVVDRVAEFLDQLQELGVLDQTLVIITADHGEYFGEHERWTHGTQAWEDLISIPLLIRPPGGLSSVKTVAHPSSQVDVVPTILDYLDIPRPSELAGQTLRPFIEGQAADPEHELLTECTWESIWSYRKGGMKLILLDEKAERERLLFDLQRDRAEIDNLADQPSMRALRDRFEGECDQWRSNLAATALESETIPIEGSVEEELRKLGYVE